MSDTTVVLPSGEATPEPQSDPKKPKKWYEKALYVLATLGFLLVMIAIGFTAVLKAVAIIALMLIILVLLANLDMWGTQIEQDTVAFTTKGASNERVVPNVTGFKMSTHKDLNGFEWLIPIEKDGINETDSLFSDSMYGTVWFQKWLWRRLGIFLLGWKYPQIKKHRFDIHSKKRLKEPADLPADAKLKNRIVNSTREGKTFTTIVDSLLHKVPRPMYFEGITLGGDNTQINLLLLATYRLIVPEMPVYRFKGDFFTQLDARAEVYFTNLLSEGKWTLDKWAKEPKSGETNQVIAGMFALNADKAYRKALVDKVGEKSELVKYLDEITHGTLIGEPGENDKVPGGIIPRLGFVLESLVIVDWEPHGETSKLTDILREKETAKHTAETEVILAGGQRKANEERALGHAALLRDSVEAIAGITGVDANIAVDLVKTDVRTRNLGANQNLSVYVEGGASVPIAITAKS